MQGSALVRNQAQLMTYKNAPKLKQQVACYGILQASCWTPNIDRMVGSCSTEEVAVQGVTNGGYILGWSTEWSLVYSLNLGSYHQSERQKRIAAGLEVAVVRDPVLEAYCTPQFILSAAFLSPYEIVVCSTDSKIWMYTLSPLDSILQFQVKSTNREYFRPLTVSHVNVLFHTQTTKASPVTSGQDAAPVLPTLTSPTSVIKAPFVFAFKQNQKSILAELPYLCTTCNGMIFCAYGVTVVCLDSTLNVLWTQTIEKTNSLPSHSYPMEAADMFKHLPVPAPFNPRDVRSIYAARITGISCVEKQSHTLGYLSCFDGNVYSFLAQKGTKPVFTQFHKCLVIAPTQKVDKHTASSIPSTQLHTRVIASHGHFAVLAQSGLQAINSRVPSSITSIVDRGKGSRLFRSQAIRAKNTTSGYHTRKKSSFDVHSMDVKIGDVDPQLYATMVANPTPREPFKLPHYATTALGKLYGFVYGADLACITSIKTVKGKIQQKNSQGTSLVEKTAVIIGCSDGSTRVLNELGEEVEIMMYSENTGQQQQGCAVVDIAIQETRATKNIAAWILKHQPSIHQDQEQHTKKKEGDLGMGQNVYMGALHVPTQHSGDLMEGRMIVTLDAVGTLRFWSGSTKQLLGTKSSASGDLLGCLASINFTYAPMRVVEPTTIEDTLVLIQDGHFSIYEVSGVQHLTQGQE